MLKKFWHLLGPVILALSLVVITLLSFPSHLKLSFKQERENAVSLTDNSFKNGEIKTQAFTDQKKNFVPFFGSSEWSRMDSMHPSVLAKNIIAIIFPT
ncbi:putative secreted protein [Streptococcus parauberis KCTC 11537]|nr:putative secreted protein [Streptococcus parauberis KCTC 11537]